MSEVKSLKKIFIVDDNETNLATAKSALKDHYTLMCMLSADRMFKMLEKIIPDLILLDIEMPMMTGIQALKIIRNSDDPVLRDLKVVFLTSHGSGGNVSSAMTHHAQDFITKPFVPDDLRKRVAKVLATDYTDKGAE